MLVKTSSGVRNWRAPSCPELKTFDSVVAKLVIMIIKFEKIGALNA